MSSLPTIVVVHASVGSGHKIAAESVAAELRTLNPEVRVRVLDVLDFGTLRISGNSAASIVAGPMAPVYNAVWGSVPLGRAVMAAGRPALRGFFGRFERWLRENRPVAVVATHALAANLAVQAAARNANLKNMPIIAVATDFGVHGYWPRRGLSLFCVADDASARELQHRGMPEDAIAVTGIPVRPQFMVSRDAIATRERLDLPPERRLLLALAGASMPGPYEHFKTALAVALPAIAGLPDTAVAVVTGRDTAFADELRKRASGITATNVRILGYTENMADLMGAADLGICKPGGLVTAECIDSGLPVVLVGPSAGQERANVHTLVRAGTAVDCEDPRRLTEVARKTISNPAKLAQMREATLKLARPTAAIDIAERILRLIG
ncbi:MAG: hypothetical protein HGA39_03135 [Coriobacteriia bacterium]|nr:hypothetical protein [Coriobacteriia bacterium]